MSRTTVPAASTTVNTPLDRVERLIEAGCPVSDAIRIVVGGSIPKWAARHGLSRTPASMTISGRRVPADARTVAALARDLETSEEHVRELLLRATAEAAGVEPAVA